MSFIGLLCVPPSPLNLQSQSGEGLCHIAVVVAQQYNLVGLHNPLDGYVISLQVHTHTHRYGAWVEGSTAQYTDMRPCPLVKVREREKAFRHSDDDKAYSVIHHQSCRWWWSSARIEAAAAAAESNAFQRRR